MRSITRNFPLSKMAGSTALVFGTCLFAMAGVLFVPMNDGFTFEEEKWRVNTACIITRAT